MYIYITERIKIKNKTLIHTTPDEICAMFPGYTIDSCKIVAMRHKSDGRIMFEIELNDSHTAQEKTDFKANVAQAFNQASTLDASGAQDIADNISGVAFDVVSSQLVGPDEDGYTL